MFRLISLFLIILYTAPLAAVYQPREVLGIKTNNAIVPLAALKAGITNTIDLQINPVANLNEINFPNELQKVKAVLLAKLNEVFEYQTFKQQRFFPYEAILHQLNAHSWQWQKHCPEPMNITNEPYEGLIKLVHIEESVIYLCPEMQNLSSEMEVITLFEALLWLPFDAVNSRLTTSILDLTGFLFSERWKQVQQGSKVSVFLLDRILNHYTTAADVLSKSIHILKMGKISNNLAGTLLKLKGEICFAKGLGVDGLQYVTWYTPETNPCSTYKALFDLDVIAFDPEDWRFRSRPRELTVNGYTVGEVDPETIELVSLCPKSYLDNVGNPACHLRVKNGALHLYTSINEARGYGLDVLKKRGLTLESLFSEEIKNANINPGSVLTPGIYKNIDSNEDLSIYVYKNLDKVDEKFTFLDVVIYPNDPGVKIVDSLVCYLNRVCRTTVDSNYLMLIKTNRGAFRFQMPSKNQKPYFNHYQLDKPSLCQCKKGSFLAAYGYTCDEYDLKKECEKYDE